MFLALAHGHVGLEATELQSDAATPEARSDSSEQERTKANFKPDFFFNLYRNSGPTAQEHKS